jgi:hypothetical protein
MEILRTVDYIAPRLNIKKHQLYALVRQAFFPPGVVIRLNRQIRFDETRLMEFLEDGANHCVNNRKDGGEIE